MNFNSICAGGVFTFPLMSPGLATQFNLSQPQLTTIVLACVLLSFSQILTDLKMQVR